MGLLSSIGSALKSAASAVGTFLSDTFLPSEEVAASRREAVFGTESKAIATTAILTAGTIGLAATLPASAVSAVGAAVGTGLKKVGSLVASSFVKSPIATTAGVLVGIPTVAGIISEKPSLVTTLPAKAFNAGAGLVNAIEEHPIASAIIGSVAGGTILYEGAKKILGSDSGNTTLPTVAAAPASTASSELPASSISTPSSSTVPLTPATQVLGKSVSTSYSGSRKKTKKGQLQNQIKVNVINNNYSRAVSWA